MDDQNNKKGYDDFFREHNDEQQDASGRNEQDQYEAEPVTSDLPEQTAKPSYYYSYGPFKAGAQSDSSQPNRYQSTTPQSQPEQGYSHASPVQDAGDTSYAVSDDDANVTVSQPVQQQIRPFTPTGVGNKGPWTVREPKRTSFKAMFASFLAGVVLVGGLMWTADTRNWFTSDQVQATVKESNGSGTTAGAGSTGGGSATTAGAPSADVAGLFETASPAVVKIETFTKVSNGGGSMLDDSFFRQFFGNDFPGTEQQEEQGTEDQMQQTGIGTGFFFDKTGYILTNQHVVGESDKIEVIVQGYDKPFTAELLGSSYDLDLAVLKVTGENNKDFPTLPLGSSEDINIGDTVVAIGNPYGFDHTVTVGVLSAKERPIDIQDTQGERNYEHLLQTDASINPGNSGGPLLNLEGEVVGINTAVSSQAQGIGFAIPTSTIQEVLESLKSNVEIPKEAVPFIGAELSDVTEEIAKQLGLSKAEGSIVRNVYYKSPAHVAGIQQYDVIVGIGGKKYSNTQSLIDAIKKQKVDDKVQMNIIRQGKEQNIEVVIGDKNKFVTE
ncbi:S1C family serine protease [Paenibacillus harenae]|uniref:S1C family serine protease n=1 Tax=Paenibacillus harenae TaxID=306543 RepID=UPI0027901C13|nr:trypsin-like peptidase domain-containing protein [Paenibacillus harenae]MDQ0060820.1 S1-C subfamily serine protease [Paenibacillus harenae]